MLTFSRRAAGELRYRVTARLGQTIREPIARTLHSYAFGVLRLANRRGADLDAPLPPPRLLSGAEQDVLIRELVEGRDPRSWPVELRPALGTRAFAGELRDLLMRAVERGLDGPALVALGRARRRPDWIAAGEFLAEYQNVTSLAKPGAYDPSELIRSALNALRADPELLAAERAQRRHLFVDEYQDTDPAQGELLALLADAADELVLVGDPDQSIYAFRGADQSAIHDVDARFGRGGEVAVAGARGLAAVRAAAARGYPAGSRSAARPGRTAPVAAVRGRSRNGRDLPVPHGQRGSRLPRGNPAPRPPRRAAVVADGGARPVDRRRPRRAAPRADRRGRTGGRARRRPPTRRTARGRDAARGPAPRARPCRPDRGRCRAVAARADRRRRRRLPAAAAPGAAPA